jgi:hypothetical protein
MERAKSRYAPSLQPEHCTPANGSLTGRVSVSACELESKEPSRSVADAMDEDTHGWDNLWVDLGGGG